MPKKYQNIWLLTVVIFIVAACNRVQTNSTVPADKDEKRKLGFGSIVGEDLLNFGGRNKNTNLKPTFSINQYLWKAGLQALEFMPLISVDSLGGVIITDWYSTSSVPNEKFKVSVHIYGTVLRADALKVVVHKQIRISNGQWVQSAPSGQVATDLENIILSKARQLKIHHEKG